MTTARSVNNANKMIDWTTSINEIENQFGFIRSQNLFQKRPTSQTAIVFDKSSHDITLLPQSDRSGRESTVGKGRKVETFSLPLAYFKHTDRITPEDIQDWRAPDDSDQEETLNRVRVEKLTDMRLTADQTDEYLQLQAMKGIFKTPEGTEVANMFTEFDVTQLEVDFVLGTSTTNIDAKIQEVKRHITSKIKSGGAIQGINVFVDESFFDKLVNHPKFREVYIQYINSGKQLLRDDLADYFSWGITDVVEHRGVTFISYPAEFNLPNGTTEKAFETDEGVAVARGVRDLFRGYYGPANKLSSANKAGQPMFAYEYTDPRDEYHDLQLEMAPLYFCTRPQSIVKVSSSN